MVKKPNYQAKHREQTDNNKGKKEYTHDNCLIL